MNITAPQHWTSIPLGWKPLQRTQVCPEVEKHACLKAEHLTNTLLLAHFSPPERETKVNSSNAALRSLASQLKNGHTGPQLYMASIVMVSLRTALSREYMNRWK